MLVECGLLALVFAAGTLGGVLGGAGVLLVALAFAVAFAVGGALLGALDCGEGGTLDPCGVAEVQRLAVLAGDREDLAGGARLADEGLADRGGGEVEVVGAVAVLGGLARAGLDGLADLGFER